MPFICKICKKRCVKENEFVAHMNWHASFPGEFLIKCEFCDRLFDHQQHMENHTFFVHVRQKPTIKCQLCDKVFAHKRSFIRHNKSAHLNSKEFICSICSKGFGRKEYLDKHYLVHERECEMNLVVSRNESLTPVTKVDTDTDNEVVEIQEEEDKKKMFMPLTGPTVKTGKTNRQTQSCAEMKSSRTQLVNNSVEYSNVDADMVIGTNRYGSGDIKIESDIDSVTTNSENVTDINSFRKRRSSSKSCEKNSECNTLIETKKSTNKLGCISKTSGNNYLKNVTKQFGSVTYVEEYVHDPHLESDKAESKAVETKDISVIGSDDEMSKEGQGCPEINEVDQSSGNESGIVTGVLETLELARNEGIIIPYSYVKGLDSIVTEHLKIPLTVDLALNYVPRSTPNKSKSVCGQGKERKQKQNCRNVKSGDCIKRDEFLNEQKACKMENQPMLQGKIHSISAICEQDKEKENEKCDEHHRRKRKSNLDCWKKATGTNDIKVSSYCNDSVDVVEYSNNDILVVECFKDVEPEVSSVTKNVDGDDDDVLVISDSSDEEGMIVVKQNDYNILVDNKKSTVDRKRKSSITNDLSLLVDTGNSVKGAEGVFLETNVSSEITFSGDKIYVDDQICGRKKGIGEHLEQNLADTTKQMENSIGSEKCWTDNSCVHENKHMYRNFIVGNLSESFAITDANANGKGLDLSVKCKSQVSTSKSSKAGIHGNLTHITKEFKRVENRISKNDEDVNKWTSLKGFIDKTNQKKNVGVIVMEPDRNRNSVTLPVLSKSISVDRKVSNDKDCIIIEDSVVNEACLNKLLKENNTSEMTDNLKDLDEFLNWSVELNESRVNLQPNNKRIDCKQDGVVPIDNAKNLSLDTYIYENSRIIDKKIGRSNEDATDTNNTTTNDIEVGSQLRNINNCLKAGPKSEHVCHNKNSVDEVESGQIYCQNIDKNDIIDNKSHSMVNNIEITGSCEIMSTVDKSTFVTEKAPDEKVNLVSSSSHDNIIIENVVVVEKLTNDHENSDNFENSVMEKHDARNKYDLFENESHRVKSLKKRGKRKCYVLCTRVEDEAQGRKKLLLNLKKGKHGDSPHIVRVTKEGMIIDVTEEYQQYLPDNLD